MTAYYFALYVRYHGSVLFDIMTLKWLYRRLCFKQSMRGDVAVIALDSRSVVCKLELLDLVSRTSLREQIYTRV